MCAGRTRLTTSHLAPLSLGMHTSVLGHPAPFFLRRARKSLRGYYCMTNSVVLSPIPSLHLQVRLSHTQAVGMLRAPLSLARPSCPSVWFSFGLGCTTTTSTQTRDPESVATRLQPRRRAYRFVSRRLTNVGTVVFRLFPLPQNGDLFKVPSL
jgi:hypothetical protein